MVNLILPTAFFLLSTFNPVVSFASISTPEGLIHCLETAQKKLSAMGATGITFSVDPSTIAVSGYVQQSSLISVWCRGPEAVITVTGGNTTSLRDHLKNFFYTDGNVWNF